MNNIYSTDNVIPEVNTDIYVIITLKSSLELSVRNSKFKKVVFNDECFCEYYKFTYTWQDNNGNFELLDSPTWCIYSSSDWTWTHLTNEADMKQLCKSRNNEILQDMRIFLLDKWILL